MNVVLRRRKLGLGSCNGIKQFSKEGITWVRNDRPIPQAEYTFRWGCTSNIPNNTIVVNEAKAIHYVADKRQFRIDTAAKNLAPRSWGSYAEFIDQHDGARQLQQSVVVRRATHHQGRFLNLCSTVEELVIACRQYGEGNYYISEYIPKVAEFRVFIVQGRVVWVAQKTPANPDAVAWNVAQGGRFDNVRFDQWPLRAIRVAREAFLLSGLDFGGVDVMVDADNKPYVLEINSAPSQTSPYRQECTAKAFDYIVKHGKAPINIIQERGGYTKFIHPAISDQAIMV